MSATAFSVTSRSVPRPSQQLSLHGPIARGYANGIYRAVLRDALIVLAAVEGIFLTESVISNLLPRVLEHGASFIDFLWLAALTVPGGLYLALPLAILIAVYLVLLRRREASEFTVLAGMGYGSGLLIRFALAMSIAGFLVSSILAGFVEPHARYQLRLGLFNIAIDELRSGEMAAGKFHVFGDLAVFASRGRIGDRATGVFVHQHLDGILNRIVLADRSLGLSNSAGRKAILLDGARVLAFNLEVRDGLCDGCGPAPRLTPASVVNLNRFFVGAPELPLPETSPRGANAPEELTTLELLAQNTAGNAAGILGERLLRGLLCLVAPLLALAAMAVTGPRTLLLALPFAGGLLLAGTFFGPRAVGWLAGFGTTPAIGGLVAAAALVMLGAVVVIRRREASCIGPARVRM